MCIKKNMPSCLKATALFQLVIKVALCPLIISILTGCVHLENGVNATCAGLIDLSQGLDGFFGDPKEDDAYHETRWKIGGGARVNKDNEYEFVGRNNLKIALPGTKESWGILIGGSTEKEPLSVDTYGGASQPDLILSSPSSPVQPDKSSTESESFLRLYVKERPFLDWDFDVGAKYNEDWKMFARLRAKRIGTIGTNSYYVAQEVFWRNTGEEFGLKTVFELDQPIGPCAVLREFISFYHHHKSVGVDIYTGLKLRTWAGRKMGVGIELINFLTTDPWEYRYTDFLCRIRRTIGREWFEIELTPKMRMRKLSDEWKQELSAELVLALIFDAEHVIRQNNHN
ncbi:MAG: hypothetical protein WBM02_09885 [bacterium]